MFNNTNVNGDAFETPARQTPSTSVTVGAGGVFDFFATQDDGFADGCSFQPQSSSNGTANVPGGMRNNCNNVMSLMGLTSTPQMTPGADDPHRAFRDAFAVGNRENNPSQSGGVTLQQGGVPSRAASIDGDCLFPTAITNHYGGQQAPRAIPTHNPIPVAPPRRVPSPSLPPPHTFTSQQQQQQQASFPTNVANYTTVPAANVLTANNVSHHAHPTSSSANSIINTNGYGASYLARQQNQKQSQQYGDKGTTAAVAGQINSNDARFGSYLRFLTTTSHQMPSASYYQEDPIVAETASKPVGVASAGPTTTDGRSTAAAAPLPFHKQLEAQLHEHKMKEIRHIQNQIGGIGVGGGGSSGFLSPNTTIATAAALPQIVANPSARREKGSTTNVIGSQIGSSSSPPTASQVPLQSSTTNALYLQYATAAAASAGAPLYAGHGVGVGGSETDASFSSHRAPSQTPFTQQNAVQAPTDLLTYIRAVRDGSFDQRQKQLQEMQRYGLVSHLHYSYPSSSGGGGLHQSPNNHAAAPAGAASPNANNNSASSVYYTSPSSSSSAPLSSADVLRRQQEAMERKKAANLQRWLALGASNVPQQLVAHYKPHLEDIQRQEEERKAKAAAVQQALMAKNPLSLVSSSQAAPLSSSPPVGLLNSQQQQHSSHSDTIGNSNVEASPLHNLRSYASTTLSAMAASSDANDSSLAAAAGNGGQPQFSSTATVDGASVIPLYVQLAEAERLAKEKQFEKKLCSMVKRTGTSKDGDGVEEGDSRGGGHGRGRSAFGRGRGRGAARVAGKKSSRATAGEGDDDETQDPNSEPLRPAGGGEAEGGADEGPTGTGRGKAPGKKKAGGTPKQPAAIKALEALLKSGGGSGAQTAAPARTLLSISGVKGGGVGGNNSLTPSAADLPLPPVEVGSWVEGIHNNENSPPALAKLLKFISDHNDDPAQMVGAVIAIIAEITSTASQSKPSASATSAVASSQETESSFSLCSKHDGKILFTANDSPKIAANLLHKTYVFFKGIVFELDQTTSFCMFNAIFTKDIEVEIVTFHASAILVPLLSYHGGSAFSANNVNDLRTMAWMLNPNNHCPCFDSLQLSHGHNATFFPSSSRSGIIQRLPVVMDLYQKMYGGLGHTGLLQPYMRQEKSMGLLCCIMKYNGFCVRTDLADSARASAERQMDEMKEKAVQFISANCPQFFSPGGADGGDDGRTGEFNIQSTKDLQSVLFTYMGLDKYLYTPSGSIISPKFITGGGKYSTSEEVLRHLSKHEHTFVPLVMNYRKLAKLTQTYFNGVLAKENLFPFYDDADVNSMVALAAAVRTEDGSTGGASKGAGTVAAGSSSTLCCVHANFNQGTTDTGRLSCVDPNIQNLPRCVDQQQQKPQQQQSLLGPLVSPPMPASPSAVCVVDDDCPLDMALATAVRTSFVARPGHSLVAVDYEQIELRVLAHLSHDPKLLKVLCSDDAAEKDIHKRIAAEVFCKPIANISTEERTQAKRVVFGTLYGAGPGAFAAELGITEDRARAIQNFFWRAFPSVERYQRDVLNKCRQTREVRTIVGRLRKIPDIVDAPYGSPARSAAERQAFNTCVQGSAADIVKKAMAHVFTEVLCKNYATVTPRNSTTLSGEEVDGRGEADGAAMDGRPLLLCQIHDELIFSVPNRYLSKIVPDIRKAMVNCFALLVPLKVSVKYGSSLGTLRDWSVDGDIGLFDAV